MPAIPQSPVNTTFIVGTLETRLEQKTSGPAQLFYAWRV